MKKDFKTMSSNLILNEQDNKRFLKEIENTPKISQKEKRQMKELYDKIILKNNTKIFTFLKHD